MHGISEKVGKITEKFKKDFAVKYVDYVGMPAANNYNVVGHCARQQQSLEDKGV